MVFRDEEQDSFQTQLLHDFRRIAGERNNSTSKSAHPSLIRPKNKFMSKLVGGADAAKKTCGEPDHQTPQRKSRVVFFDPGASECETYMRYLKKWKKHLRRHDHDQPMVFKSDERRKQCAEQEPEVKWRKMEGRRRGGMEAGSEGGVEWGYWDKGTKVR